MTEDTDQLTADVVIAGGGPAGCIIAGRLADAFPDLEIVLIEQGENNKDDEVSTRPLDGLLKALTPSPSIRTMQSLDVNRAVQVGNVLGGGTTVNWMCYTNAAASDFDDWHQPGWSFAELEPFFHKCIDDATASVDRTGVPKGRVQVTAGGYDQSKVWESFANGLDSVKGLPRLQDVADFRHGHGHGPMASWISHDGRRADVAVAYLHDKGYGSPPSKLRIMTGKTVGRVLLDNDRAVGVELCDASEDRVVKLQVLKARKQVVLCAGALGTPAILERSGIGSRQVLEHVGLEVKVDLPGVGDEHRNHQRLRFVCHLADGMGTLDPYWEDPSVAKMADKEWKATGKGMVSTNGIGWQMKLRPTEAESRAMGPAFENYWSTFGADKVDKALGIASFMAGYPAPRTDIPLGQYVVAGPLNHYPASKGSVHISSSDPFATPVLNGGTIKDDIDLPVLVWLYKRCRQAVHRVPAFRGDLSSTHPSFPDGSRASCVPLGSENSSTDDLTYTAADDAAIEKWVRETLMLASHSHGTCPMKPRQEGGVVDNKLNVYGIQCLKVADLSIATSNLSANTATTACIVGEKAANLIMGEINVVHD